MQAKTSTVPAAVDSSSDAVGTEADSPAPPGPSKTKRERKTKFNVREVLNLKETSPKVAKASSSTKVSSSSKQSKSDSSSLLDGVNSEPYERSDKVFEADTVTAVEEVGGQEEVGGGDIEVVDLSESFDVKSEAGCGVSETGSEGTPSEKENINSDNGVREHGGQGRALTNGGTNGVSEVRESILFSVLDYMIDCTGSPFFLAPP